MFKKSNCAKGNLSAQLLIAGTSLVLGTNEGLKFPATGSGNTFVGVIWGAAFASPEGDATSEFVVAYRSSGDTFTIVRAQEGTAAKQWEIGDNFMLTASAAVFNEYETALGNYVLKSLYDANSVLMATSDNTPIALAIAASTIVGRKSTGDIVALTATELRAILNVADGANAYTHPNHSGDVTSVADGAQTIAAAAVSLAKMANLAQDQFIGRVTASTGVPETATITAAARTVLDDTTVGGMVDTLGGATATGSGGIARATAPTFATSITGSYLTASEILITDGSKNIVSAAVATYPSLTELSYVKGLSSAIQTQLNAKAGTAAASTSAAGLAIQATAPAAGLYNYLGITNGETAYTNKALFDATVPSTQAYGDAAATGSAVVAARRDHKHAMPAAYSLADEAVTNAKLAHIATSTIKGRVSAATGDPEDLTAANVRTIINVADGATANAKASGAELDTATDDAKFATAKAIKDAHNVPSVAPGTSGNVLTSNGTDWTSAAAAGGGTPQSLYATIFETQSRFEQSLTGGGGTTYGTSGLVVTTSATQASAVRINLNGGISVYTGNAVLSCHIGSITSGSDYQFLIAVSQVTVSGTSITFTDKHYGFKWVRASSGAVVASATNADGSAETATAMSTAEGDCNLVAVKTGTTSIKYYRERVLQATHTTNIPTAVTHGEAMGIGITNANVASNSAIYITQYSLSVDAF